MADYDKILSDPYNPVKKFDDHALFPSWLTNDVLYKKDLPTIKGVSFDDQVIRKHASFYEASVWYPQISKWTPESLSLIHI